MATTRARPQVEERTVPADDSRSRREHRIATGLLVVTFGFAIVFQTLFFHFSSTMGGDVEYHRAVGYSMTSGPWQGEGPIQGVIAYFGGLYPMVLGWGSHLLGVSFDGLLSVVSWPFVLVMPLALYWLGRSLWPEERLEPAVLAFVGTVGSSLALDDRATWVNGLLLSGANLWPIYPRDVALVLTIVSLAIVIGGDTRLRAALGGVALGVAICVQAQVAMYGIAVVGAFLLWRAWPMRAWRDWIGQTIWFVASAALVSVWWWVPRVSALVESRGLALESYPGKTTPNITASGILVALGVVGLLAIPGAVIALRQRRVGVRFAGVWLVAIAPWALVSGVVGDLGIITSRRTWLLASIPLVLCAAVGATALLRRWPAPWVLVLLLAAILVPSAAEALQTRDRVAEVWVRKPIGDPYSEARWDPALDRLRDASQERGSVLVLAPDNDALYVWRHSGAHPFSFLQAGAAKLGFDLERLTGKSYIERVRTSERAQGIPARCALAGEEGADFFVLRRDGDLLGTYDSRPSARYRVDPRSRTTDTIDRRVGPGLRYLDLSATELLEVAPGAGMELGWSSPDVRRVDVYQDRARPVPPMVLVLPDGRRITPRLERAGSALILQFPTPDGVPRGAELVANDRGRARVSRVVGYERVDGIPESRGPVVIDPATLC
jgi:hypothetical protein